MYVTEGCSKYKHPEIMFEVGEGVPEVDALHFKATLEGMVASGSRFKAGTNFPGRADDPALCRNG